MGLCWPGASFYTKYAYNNPLEQYQEFRQTVLNILMMCEKEYANGNLDKAGVWLVQIGIGKRMATIKVDTNMVAPYKRARQAINRAESRN